MTLLCLTAVWYVNVLSSCGVQQYSIVYIIVAIFSASICPCICLAQFQSVLCLIMPSAISTSESIINYSCDFSNATGLCC